MTRNALDGFLCCLVGADQYALRGPDVTLVARAEQMRTGSEDDGRVGTLARRGADIPVFALGGLLGGARDARTADRHVIVTGDPAEPYGLLVDRIVRATTAESMLPMPWVVGGSAVRWFRGVITLAETSCLVLAPEGLRSGGARTAPSAPGASISERAPALDCGLLLAFSSVALPPAASLAASRYAVSAARVAAVVQTLPLLDVPGREPHVAALGIWRNALVAVLDLGDGAFAPAAARRFLILRTDGDALVAIAVDVDTTLRHASAADVPSRGSGLSGLTGRPDYVRGVFTSAGEAVALLDVESLV
jgi:chemotaxis signal transduction protein